MAPCGDPVQCCVHGGHPGKLDQVQELGFVNVLGQREGRPTQPREAYSFFLQPLWYFNQFAIESGESLCGSFLCECLFSPNSFWNTLYFTKEIFTRATFHDCVRLLDGYL